MIRKLMVCTALAGAVLVGNASAQHAPGYTAPKTSWGVPDVQGFWNSTSTHTRQARHTGSPIKKRRSGGCANSTAHTLWVWLRISVIGLALGSRSKRFWTSRPRAVDAQHVRLQTRKLPGLPFPLPPARRGHYSSSLLTWRSASRPPPTSWRWPRGG